MTGPASLAKRPWVLWTTVVAVAFAIYNMNFRELGLADTIPATLLPVSLLYDGDLALDEFAPMLVERTQDGSATLRAQMEWTSAIRSVKGKLRSSYPVGAALIALPVYVVPYLRGAFHHFSDFRIVGKVAASLIAALSAGFVLLCLRRFTTPRAALFLTVTYAFGTAVWTIASQALWQHGPALLCLSVALWAALRLEEDDRVLDAALVSVGTAMALVCRPQDATGALAIGLYALLRRPRRWLPLAVPAACILAWQVGYNVTAFGSPGGGYADLYQSRAHAWRGLDARSSFSLPLAEGLAGLLLSPGKGILWYSPLLAVGAVALGVGSVNRARPLPRFLGAWVVATLVLYGKNQLWWGGTAYGPRYLTELALPLTIGLGAAWPRISARPLLRGACRALAVWGVAVQALGAFTWECSWHNFPLWVDFRPDRVWDFRDPEILRCTDTLLRLGPRAAEFGPFARPEKPYWLLYSRPYPLPYERR